MILKGIKNCYCQLIPALPQSSLEGEGGVKIKLSLFDVGKRNELQHPPFSFRRRAGDEVTTG